MTKVQGFTPTDYRFGRSDFCVIAAVNNDDILDACLKLSPEIASEAVPLVIVRGARSMGQAYNSAMSQTDAAICIFAHQDIYFPAGWFERAAEVLTDLTKVHPEWLVAGPYGVRADGRHVGRIYDANFASEIGSPNFPPSEVGSLDEIVLILRRTEGFEFDPELPHFHLYGTDIVQSAQTRGGSAWAVELPVVHNDRPVATLMGGYRDAYLYTRRKWRDRLPIRTTICAVTRNPLSFWRAQWRCRHAGSRSDQVSSDSRTLAIAAGYEKHGSYQSARHDAE